MQISGHIAKQPNLQKGSLRPNVRNKLRKVSTELRPLTTLDSKFTALSNPVGLKTRKTYSNVTLTLLMISKHGSPPNLGQLCQYFFYIDNKIQLNADLWSYSKAFKFIKKIGGSKRTRRVAKGFNRAANAYDAGQQISNTFRSRGLEDDEYLYGRDLDVEEFFGREYDLLEERDAIDDLD